MPKVDIVDLNNQTVGAMDLADAVFGAPVNEALLYEAVRNLQAGLHRGTHKTKPRGEVAGAGKKLWKQKGTGRARAGQANSPLWRGGGKIFPSSPDENFSQKLNRKMYRAGLASILSQLVREERLSVIDALVLDAPKTKQFAQKMKGYRLDGTVLVVTDKLDDNIYLSSRNLPNVLVLETREVDPVTLVRFQHVLLTKAAVAQFEELLS